MNSQFGLRSCSGCQEAGQSSARTPTPEMDGAQTVPPGDTEQHLGTLPSAPGVPAGKAASLYLPPNPSMGRTDITQTPSLWGH